MAKPHFEGWTQVHREGSAISFLAGTGSHVLRFIGDTQVPDLRLKRFRGSSIRLCVEISSNSRSGILIDDRLRAWVRDSSVSRHVSPTKAKLRAAPTSAVAAAIAGTVTFAFLGSQDSYTSVGSRDPEVTPTSNSSTFGSRPDASSIGLDDTDECFPAGIPEGHRAGRAVIFGGLAVNLSEVDDEVLEVRYATEHNCWRILEKRKSG